MAAPRSEHISDKIWGNTKKDNNNVKEVNRERIWNKPFNFFFKGGSLVFGFFFSFFIRI